MASPLITIRTQRENFSVEKETSILTKGRLDIGAVVSFTGLCRDEGGILSSLELEHFPAMAETQMQKIAQKACERWDLSGLTGIHRYGNISAGENIVLVIAASPHRQEAFDGANYMMDFLKSNAPFWKKEHGIDGQASNWVEAKDADEAALKKWLD